MLITFDYLIGQRFSDLESIKIEVAESYKELAPKSINLEEKEEPLTDLTDDTILIDFEVNPTLEQENAMLTLFYIKTRANEFYITECLFDFI